MESKKFIAKNMNSALKLVKAEFGEDAIIVQTQNVNNQVEVEAQPYVAQARSSKLNIRLDDELESSISEFDDIILSRPTILPKTDDYLKKELASIKELLKSKTLIEVSHPIIRQLTEKLKSLGLCKEIIQYLLIDIDLNTTLDHAWESTLKKIMNDIVIDNVTLPHRKIKAIIGPNGVGKTHYMSRLIHYNRLPEYNEKFAFIFVNHSNIKTLEESKAFARLFGVPALYVESLVELNKAYQFLKPYDHVFIEFPAYDFNCLSNNDYIQFIKEHQTQLDLALVMSAGSSYPFIKKYVNLYSELCINGLSITKFDECDQIEGFVQANLKYRIPLRYFTRGSDLLTYMEAAQKHVFYRQLTLSDAGALKTCQTQL